MIRLIGKRGETLLEKYKVIRGILRGDNIVICKDGDNQVKVLVGRRIRHNKTFLLNSLFSTINLIKGVM